MKKIIIFLLFAFVSSIWTTDAQTTQKKKRRKYSSANNASKKKIYESPSDSAYMYYNWGWDAYKNNDFGAARWFWERGANCETNIPSRYSSAFRLGLLHQEGQGVGVNYEIAFYYFTLGWADGRSEGESEATKNIAAYYEIGRLVPQDYFKALDWYKRAKAQGNKYCDSDIARCKKRILELHGLKVD